MEYYDGENSMNIVLKNIWHRKKKKKKNVGYGGWTHERLIRSATP